MTVYLCLTGCIFLFFGALGLVVATSNTIAVISGAVTFIGVGTFIVAVYFRPGVDTRTTPLQQPSTKKGG